LFEQFPGQRLTVTPPHPREDFEERAMRGVATSAVALIVCLSGARAARAGVYNPAEPDWQVSDRFDQFLSTTLIPLRQFGTKEGKQSMHRRAALMSQEALRAGTAGLTAEQRLALSAYLIRVPKLKAAGTAEERPDYREAVNMLLPAQRDPRERDNFLIYANLATAEYLDGQLQRARDYLADALRMWPQDWSRLSAARRTWLQSLGWDEARYKRYRRAETYLLRYFRLRAIERPPAFGRASPLGTDVEPLFEGGTPPAPVRFVGPSGKYEAGKIAASEAAKLPPDAVEIVEQLLIWLPHDDRLFWLLGELLNARGEYVTAGEQVFAWVGDKLQTLANKNDAFAKAAGQLDQGKPPQVRALADRRSDEFLRLPEVHRNHLDVLITKVKEDRARAAPAPPQGEPKASAPPANVAPRKSAPASTPGGALPIDMRSLTVGFVAGLIVMVFALWQVREVRRRLQARAAARADAPVAPWTGGAPQEGITVKREEGRPG
jgi:tetratricopeptide (TPR) repeat protein